MIDKVQISTSNFEIEDDSTMRIHPAPYTVSELDSYKGGGILYQCGGRFVYGAKAVINTDKYNLTINPNFGMEVHWNPARVMGRSNFYKVSEGELHKSIDIIQDELLGKGILIDVDSSPITRMDIAQDEEMGEPFDAYVQLFRLLRAKRAKPKELENGYYFLNGNRALVFYDKGAEMKAKDKDSELPFESDVMRCEHRMLTKDAVQRFSSRYLNVTDIAALRKASFKDILAATQVSITDFAFKDIPAPDTFAISHKTESDILRAFRREFRRGAIARYHEVRINLQRFGSIDNYRSILLSAGFDKGHVSRIIRDVKKSISIIEEIEAKNGEANIGILYEEIFQKFMASKAAA